MHFPKVAQQGADRSQTAKESGQVSGQRMEGQHLWVMERRGTEGGKEGRL